MATTSFVKRVVKTCLRIGKGDRVTIFSWRHTLDLAEALTIECVKAGAKVHTEFATDKIFYDNLENSSLKYLETSNPFDLAIVDVATANIFISGPEDPERLKEISAERWSAVSKAGKPFYDKFLKKKIRSAEIRLGLVTPQRAKTYGFNYQEWKKNVQASLDVKYEDMRNLGLKVRSALEKAHEVHVTGKGTDLKFHLEERPINIFDGVIDDEDIERGAVFVGLPSGQLALAPGETSANGFFTSDIPEPTTGVLAHDIKWTFEDGRLTSFEGGENSESVKEMWERGTGDKDRIGWFILGLNPKVKTGFTHNAIVFGKATIGIGDNSYYGGNNKSDWGFAITISEPTIKVDGKLKIKQGQLKL